MTEKIYPDFDPKSNYITILMSKEEFLKKKLEAANGPVMIGGIYHNVSFSEDGLITILVPVAQTIKRN